MHRYWKPSKTSNYDIALIYYGDNEGYPEENQTKAKGPKYQLIYDYINDHPEIYDDYQYIWMPDDDIVMNNNDIQRLFKISYKHNLLLSQPSLMGWYGLDITLHHKDCFLRYTNYVEIMCPCFRSEALKKCIGTFLENKTGWGIDHVWNKILGHPTDKIAIIDDVIAFHTRTMGGGDTYKNQSGGSMSNAEKEGHLVWEKYKLDESSYKDLEKGKLVSTESFGMFYHNLVEYNRIYKQTEAGIDVSKRLWPPNDIIKKLCEDLRKNN